jgi:hypothetical protein
MKGWWPWSALVLSLSTGSAGAAAPTTEVRAEPGLRCISSHELAQRVEQAFVGVQPPGAGYSLRVTITRQPDRFEADVSWQGADRPQESRVITAPLGDCRELDDAIAVIARALWDPTAPQQSDAASNNEAAAPVLPAAAPPVSPPGVEKPRGVRSRDWRRTGATPIEVGGGTALSVGLVDAARLVVTLEARLPLGSHAALRLGVGALPWTASAEVDRGRVELAALTGRVAGCWALPTRPALDLCSGLQGGVLATRGSQIRGDVTTQRPVLWPIGLVAARHRLAGPLIVGAELAGGPALFRDDYYVKDSQGQQRSVRSAQAALLQAGLWLGFALP